MKSGQSSDIAPPVNAAYPHAHSPLCRHDVQFYFDDRFLIRSLSDFIRSTLQAGSAAIVVGTRSHRLELAEDLRLQGVALSKAIDAGRYIAMDAADTLESCIVDGIPDDRKFARLLNEVISSAADASSTRDSSIAIFGEMVPLLWQRGEMQAALRLEQLWTQLSQDYPLHLCCGYPISSFDKNTDTEMFRRICAAHDTVLPAEGYFEVRDENDGLRSLALLQQTEQALKSEVEKRRTVEAERREIQSHNQRLLKEIRNHETVEADLRRCTRRLLHARDQEQRRIAAELHENTAQLVAALSLYFGVIHQEKASLNPRLANAVASSRSVSDSLLSEIRKLSQLLHPPTLDDMGLASALQEYVDRIANSSRARIQLEVAGDLGRFDHNLEIMVFRIIEEALGAVPRSENSSATVRLHRSDSTLTLEIESQYPARNISEGSSRSETRFTGIHERVMERGGSVHFTSSPSGMLVSVQLPTAVQHRSASN